VVFGDAEITSGASGDIQRVASLARTMVTKSGMSSLGLSALESESNSFKLGDRVDQEIRQIAKNCYEIAKRLITDHRDLCDRLVDILVDVETLDGEEFRKIVGEYTKIPEKKTASVKF
jgi:cell division protease FtsH